MCSLEDLQLLSLSHNDLSSGMPRAGNGSDGVCLPRLRTLTLDHNRLKGLVPPWALEVDYLDVTYNALAYDGSEQLIDRCFDPDISCSGLPPVSCKAFGGLWEVAANSGRHCVLCSLPQPLPLLILIGFLTAFLLLSSAYVHALPRGMPSPWVPRLLVPRGMACPSACLAWCHVAWLAHLRASPGATWHGLPT